MYAYIYKRIFIEEREMVYPHVLISFTVNISEYADFVKTFTPESTYSNDATVVSPL